MLDALACLLCLKLCWHNRRRPNQEYYNLLSNCNPYKSPGPDNVHNYVLREIAADIAPLLTHLFQQSLRTDTLPNDWKKALVTPIFKKGERNDPKNYRPVSLTGVLLQPAKSWNMLLSAIS